MNGRNVMTGLLAVKTSYDMNCVILCVTSVTSSFIDAKAVVIIQYLSTGYVLFLILNTTNDIKESSTWYFASSLH